MQLYFRRGQKILVLYFSVILNVHGSIVKGKRKEVMDKDR